MRRAFTFCGASMIGLALAALGAPAFAQPETSSPPPPSADKPTDAKPAADGTKAADASDAKHPDDTKATVEVTTPSTASSTPSTSSTSADEAAGTAPAADQASPNGEETALDWGARERALDESSTITGGTGLLRTQHAQTGAPGQFRLGFVTEWFSGGFLCTTSFPCPNPGGKPITSDSLSHIGATLSLGVSIAKLGPGVFDAYGAISAYANSDTANQAAGQPELLQVLGDTNLGLKYVAPIGDILHLGVFTELWLINGSGSVGLDGSGTSAKFGGIVTADLRGTESHVPLRFSGNLVYSLDNTGDVLGAVEQANGGTPVTRIDRYGLGVNRVDHVDILVGAEAFAVDDRIRPFVEARFLAPTNRQGYECHLDNPSADHCLANDSVVPATLTLGSRFLPWKHGFSLLAALDIGIGGTSDFIEEMQPIPPWTLFLGAGWSVDTVDRPPVVKMKIVEKTMEHGGARGHVVGFVHEKDKNDPVADAIASYRDHADLTPVATGADGKFSDDLLPGKYTYDIKAEGYKTAPCEVAITIDASAVNVDCPLEALPRAGTIIGHVRDADTNQPIANVPVVLVDPQHKEIRLTSDATGAVRFDGVAPGTGSVNVTADGYLALVTPAEVKPRQESSLDLILRPKPKQPKVQVTKNEITIREQIQFALDSAVILPESFGILTEIADTLIRHPEIKRIEVQGHTDSSGTPEHNQTLSEQRSEAVRAWIVQHGVPSDRLLARGYGQDKPLVPNVTPANRAQNRRVQFIILEKDTAAPPAAAPGAPAAPAPTERKRNPLPGF